MKVFALTRPAEPIRSASGFSLQAASESSLVQSSLLQLCRTWHLDVIASLSAMCFLPSRGLWFAFSEEYRTTGSIRNLHSCTFRSGDQKKLFLLVLVQVWKHPSSFEPACARQELELRLHAPFALELRVERVASCICRPSYLPSIKLAGLLSMNHNCLYWSSLQTNI